MRVITEKWGAVGEIRTLEPRLLERGSTRLLILPLEWTDPAKDGCTTVAVLGARSTGFLLRFLPLASGPRWANGEFPEQSVAGAAQLVRCGRRKEMLRRLAIEMRSPRGVYEVIVARSAAPFPSLRRALTHRDPGPVAPDEAPGRRLRPAPAKKRIAALERRHRRRGASAVETLRMRTRSDGSGRALIRINPGCHTLTVVGESPRNARRGLDVDLEVRWAITDELVAVDRSESIDAGATFCVGRREVAALTFLGSTPGTPTSLVHARFDLPSGLPKTWSHTARGRFAEVLHARRRGRLSGAPSFEASGVTGITAVPLELEPGGCYVAVVAATRGRVASIALAASTDRNRSQNHGGSGGTGAAVAFCTGIASRGLVEVEANGSGVGWLLGIWRTGRLPGAGP